VYIIKIELTNGQVSSVNEDFELSSMMNAYGYNNYLLARKAVKVLKQRVTGEITIIES
jgi:hypothetical protein